MEGSISCCSAGSRGTVPRAENGKALGEEIELLVTDQWTMDGEMA